ncbi:MAG: CBS domain-containing protein [Hyphomicrobiales bacterium]|nr:CBS domain-containing protein [Hyphomicrobiales bacterium]
MFGKQITLFKLFGIDVRIDLSWLLIAILISWSLATAYFPFALPDQSAGTYWVMGIAGLIGLAFSIVAHEFAHSLMARRFEMDIRHITLFVFGGVAELEGEPPNAKAEFVVAIVGPLMSFAVAFGFYSVAHLIELLGSSAPAVAVATYLATINFALAVFNLAPAFPLDGGRVFRALLWRIKGDYVRATQIAANVGVLFGFLLMVFAMVNAFYGNLFIAIWFFLLGLFVRGAAVANLQFALDRGVLAAQKVARFMRHPVVTVPPELPVSTLIEEYFYSHLHKSFPVVDGDHLLGTVDIQSVQSRSPEERARLRVADLMHELNERDIIAANASAGDAIQRMRRSQRTRLYVTDGGRLVGVVSIRDLLELIDLHLRLDRHDR